VYKLKRNLEIPVCNVTLGTQAHESQKRRRQGNFSSLGSHGVTALHEGFNRGNTLGKLGGTNRPSYKWQLDKNLTNASP